MSATVDWRSPISERWVAWRPAVRAVAPIWLITRLGFLLLGWLVPTIWPTPARSRVRHWTAWPFQVYSRYDAGYFWHIAQSGYFQRGPNDDRVAFFPGYPLVGRFVAVVLGGGAGGPTALTVAMGLVAWLGAGVGAVVLWRCVQETVSARVATVAVAALLAGPYSVFLMASYSEGLFLALAVSAWRAGHNRRWTAAGLLCGAAALVRVNGLFLLAGLVVGYLLDARRNRRRLVRVDAVALLAGPAAVFGYFAYLKINSGHWNDWFRAQQAGWYRHLSWPWDSLTTTIRYYRDSREDAVHFQAGMELLFAALFVVALAAFAYRRMWVELTFVGLTVASLLTSTFYMSVPRSTLAAFPVFVLYAQWATRTRHTWLVAATVVASSVILLITTGSFVRGFWAG
jgi:hypothetical protein